MNLMLTFKYIRHALLHYTGTP